MSTKKTRSALGSLVSDAQKDKQARSRENASPSKNETDPKAKPATPADTTTSTGRGSITIYMDRDVYDRVNVWSEFLDGVNKADILDRAVTKYCDELAKHYNGGDDPPKPKSVAALDPLP